MTNFPIELVESYIPCSFNTPENMSITCGHFNTNEFFNTLDESICAKCPLKPENYNPPAFSCAGGYQLLSGEPFKLVVISESPTPDQQAANLQMTDTAGNLFMSAVAQVYGEIPPEMLFLSTMACVPDVGGKTPTAAACKKCAQAHLLPLLLSSSLVADDAIIVAAGANAWKTINTLAKGSPTADSIIKVFSMPTELTFTGTPLLNYAEGVEQVERTFAVMPILHPAYILKMPQKIEDFTLCIQRLWKLATGGLASVVDLEIFDKVKDNAILYSDPLSLANLEEIVSYIKQGERPVVSFDVECKNLDLTDPSNALTLLGFGLSSEQAIQFEGAAMKAVTYLFRRFKEEQITVVGHNIFFDFMILYKHRLILSTEDLPNYVDTRIMAHLIDENAPASLKLLCQQYLGVPDWSTSISTYVQQYGSFAAVPTEKLRPYHAMDLCKNLDLYYCFLAIVQSEEVSQFWKIDYLDYTHRVDRTLMQMSMNGIGVNLEYKKNLEVEYTQKLAQERTWFRQPIFARVVATLQTMTKELKAQVTENLSSFPLVEEYDYAKHEFNPSSTDHVAAFIAATLSPETKLAIKKQLGRNAFTKGGSMSMKEDNLSVYKSTLLANPETKQQYGIVIETIDKVLAYREKIKSLGTYIIGIDKFLWNDGVFRPHFKIYGTVTGRLSCADPNAQNFPRDKTIKRMIVPKRPGYIFMQFDLSQAEMRGLASFSGDETLAKGYRDGLDMHKYVGSMAFNVPYDQITKDQRQAAKSIGFASIYGSSAAGLASKNGLPVTTCEELLENFFTMCSKVKPNYIQAMHKQWQETGYVIGALGRLRRLPRSLSTESGCGDLLREAQNSPIQGLASDFNMLTFLQMHELIETDNRFTPLKGHVAAVNTVHDSLVFEVDPYWAESLYDLYHEAQVQVNALFATPDIFGASWVDMAGDAEAGITYGDLLPCTKEWEPELPELTSFLAVEVTRKTADGVETKEQKSLFPYFTEELSKKYGN